MKAFGLQETSQSTLFDSTPPRLGFGNIVPRALFHDSFMPLYEPPSSHDFYEDDLVFFDTKKAEEILLGMVRAFVKGYGHYRHNNVHNAPQNTKMPGVFNEETPVQISLDGAHQKVQCVSGMERGSKEHLQWLFPAVGSDRRQESSLVYKNHALLYHARPEIYTAGDAQYMQPKELEALLRSFKFGIPEETSRYWPAQAKTLFKCFDGDPIKLLRYCNGTVAGVQKFREGWKKETGYHPLPGFGTKITSLLFLFYEELGKFPMPDDAFAVDLHVQRFFLQTGTIRIKKDVIAKDLEKRIRPFLCGFCKRHEGRWKKIRVILAHALWQNGAKLCDICPKAKGIEALCSIHKVCSGSVSTITYTQESRWRMPLFFRTKGCHRPFAVCEDGKLFDQSA